MMTSSNGTFSMLLAIYASNSPVTSEFPAQRPVTQSFGISFEWINGWVNNHCNDHLYSEISYNGKMIDFNWKSN